MMKFVQGLSILAFLTIKTSAAAVESRGKPSTIAPLARVLNGTYEGVSIPEYGVDIFMGMRYAQAPTGDLRFSQPQHLDSIWNGIAKATTLPNICPQAPAYSLNGTQMNEDCLALNVFKPTGNVANLPVVIWIHGGAYQNGYSFEPAYNLTYLVRESMDMGKPIVAVSINYRLGFFGFLASNEIVNSNNANLGLRDQRQAFKWVHENIAAFGGDPRKVTIWGESAGAESIGSHLISYGGDNAGLYRAAILESGGATVDAWNGTDYYEPIYDGYVSSLNCTQADDTLQCLRHVPYADLLAAFDDTANNLYRLDYMPIIDGDFVREWPHTAMHAGRTANVPIITGCNSDEGTVWAQTGLNTSEQLKNYLLTDNGHKLSSSAVDRLMELYPDDPSLGSPYGTGNETFPSMGLEFKRMAAMTGDYSMIAGTRFNAQTSVAHNRKVWTYHLDMHPSSAPAYYGVYHGVELPLTFQLPTSSYSTEQAKTGNFMARSFISFINDLDPNHTGLNSYPSWPSYEQGARNMVFAESVHLEKDDYREEAIAFINSHLLEFVA